MANIAYENLIKKGQVDYNDLLYVMERFGSVIGYEAAPISLHKTGVHKGKEKINPHVSRFYLSNGEVCDVFHVKPVYYLHINGDWRPMSEVASHYGNRRIDLKEDWADKMDMRYLSWLLKRMELIKGNVLIPSPFAPTMIPLTEQLGRRGAAVVHFTTDTFYPDAHPETTTVDGRSQNFSTSGVWSTMHAATDGSSADDSSANMYFQVYHRSGSNLGIDRMFYLFDTSSIADAATLSAATFSVYFDQKNDQEADAQSYFNVVQSSPASNTAITTADFDQCGAVTNPTKGASDYAFSSLPSVNNYMDVSLNSTGLGWITLTGVTKLGLREGHDIEDVDPNAGGDGVYLHVLCAETSGTTTDPKLAVTYTTSVNITVNPAAQAATFSIPAYTVKYGRTITPSAQSAVFSIPTYTVSLPKTVAPNVQVATFSIPQYVIDAGGNITIAVNPQVATFSVPAYSILKDFTVAVNALTATFSTPTPTIALGTGKTVTPLAQALTFSVPSYTVTVEANRVVTPNVQVLTFSLPTLAKVGGVWRKIGRSTNATWTKALRNSN